MRTVASLANLRLGQTAGVLRRQITLGLVERRDVASAALVGLVREHEASQALVRLAGLRDSVLSGLKDDGRAIQPSPASRWASGHSLGVRPGLRATWTC
jgi:hypothetical protein